MAFEPAPEFSSYDEVVFYRKRWFLVASGLLCMPVGAVVALTGDIYALQDGRVMRYPEKQRYTIAAMMGMFILLGGVRGCLGG